MVWRDIYSLYVEEYIGLYLMILKRKARAAPYVSFIKAQFADCSLSAIKIHFNKAQAGWGSTGVQSGGSLLLDSSSQSDNSGGPLGLALPAALVNLSGILDGNNSFLHH
jgi:hypothetical protein